MSYGNGPPSFSSNGNGINNSGYVDATYDAQGDNTQPPSYNSATGREGNSLNQFQNVSANRDLDQTDTYKAPSFTALERKGNSHTHSGNLKHEFGNVGGQGPSIGSAAARENHSHPSGGAEHHDSGTAPNLSDANRREASHTGDSSMVIEGSDAQDYVGMSLVGKIFRRFYPNAYYKGKDDAYYKVVKQGRGQYKRKTGDTKIEVRDTSEDGYQWRKYGQKVFYSSKFPRCYYRCTYLHDRGCKAKKHVQQLEDESNKFRITYSGCHTCNITLPPHTIPRHEVVLDFGGSKIQQSLTKNSSTTKKKPSQKQKDHANAIPRSLTKNSSTTKKKPSQKQKDHANAIPRSDQGGSSHSVMSSDPLAGMDFLENEDILSALQFADDVFINGEYCNTPFESLCSM